MTLDQFLDLYEKYLQGRCSAVEKAELEAYQDDFSLVELPWALEAGHREALKKQLLTRLHTQVKPGRLRGQ
jgi:transmembrane sensor